MINFKINHLTSLVVAVTLSLSLIACQKPPQSTNNQASVKVRPAHGGLPEESFRAEIVKIGLEKLGYELEPIKAVDYTAKLLAIANGELDYTVTHWEKNHQAFFGIN